MNFTTRRTLPEQLAAAKAETSRARLNWTLTKPDGTQQRGEEVLTEAEWLSIIKGLIAARERIAA